MACGISVIVKALDIKKMHVDRVKYVEGSSQMHEEKYSRDYIEIHARPYKRIRGCCPICRRKCNGYDHQAKKESVWRANSLNGVPLLIMYQPMRIECPEHGVLNEYIPWADGSSRFTTGFNNEAAFLALTCPKTVVAQFLGINWRTVGNCIKAAHDRLEPDVSERLHGLKRICVDETSYRKGHKYITVVYDIDRNRVAWVHEGYGQNIFKLFCEALTEKERDAIEVVAGDGARWIDECVKAYFKKSRRCIDFFHAVGWVNEALDKVRNNARYKAARDVEQMKKEFKEAEAAEQEEIRKTMTELENTEKELKSMPRRGRPSKRRKELEQYVIQLKKQLETYKNTQEITISEDEYKAAIEELSALPKRGRRSKRKAELLTIIALYEGKNSGRKDTLSETHQRIIDDLEKKAKDIQGAKYALGMNPENLSTSSQDKLRLIEESHPDVFRAYRMKEQLRIILHMKDVKTAEAALDQWIKDTAVCGIKPFEELTEKIGRHRQNILNSVELQVNSAKSEATNTTIKALIATARGFRNLDNMFALIYLRCSDIVIPLHNRYQPSPEKQQELRDMQNNRKRAREAIKRESALHQAHPLITH